MKRAALNLIWQYPVIAVDFTNTDFYSILLWDIFRTFQMFDWENFVDVLKNWLVICQFADDLFVIDLMIDIDS